MFYKIFNFENVNYIYNPSKADLLHKITAKFAVVVIFKPV